MIAFTTASVNPSRRDLHPDIGRLPYFRGGDAGTAAALLKDVAGVARQS